MKILNIQLSDAGQQARQTTAPQPQPAQEGFTRLELAVVLAVLAFGLLMLMPALAHTQPQVRALQCLDNLRQMQVGWRAYANDSADVMLPNGVVGLLPNQRWDGGGGEDWYSAPANTDPAYYLQGLLAPYIRNQIGLYKCPGDTIPSANGQRIRSYSMNGQMGRYYFGRPTSFGYDPINPGYVAYVKVTDLVGTVTPAKGLVFLEESMWSLQDGFLQVALPGPDWPELPGSYHNGAMGASFADGHTELHQWVSSSLLFPVKWGVTSGGAHRQVVGGASNPDWIWWKAHTAAHQ